jgi:hypothetical protein
MLQFFMGIAVGIWLGTTYDCKPIVVLAANYIAEHIPKKR